ncbi:MAG TPA: hypothetical protein VGH54_19355 [Mycobacterium sp.]|jgi:hypothetical protein|uniref:hypothetical protein n=1 Tax=Mycobacterium sp. TaxID=1785 RepID=UPI002F4190D6
MATTDEATPLQALLSLYGALDKSAIRGGAGIEATVERYLPGSTGPNVGWYDELLGFLSDSANRDSRFAEEPPAAPDLSDALTILQSQNHSVAPGAKPSLTAVQLSRMVYGIGALSHLPDDYLPRGWETQFARTLAVASPKPPEQPGYQSASVSGPPPSGPPPNGEKLLALLRRQFGSRDDFPQLMEYAAQQKWVDSLVADVPLCEVKAKFVRGHLCVVLTTEFESAKASLDEVKNVMDPLNWPKCLPFFCSMDKEDNRPDGWRRVLEHVSTTCPIPGTPQMVTPLKYWNGQDTSRPQPSAWVNYALDDDPAPGEKGDGRMVVDDGFIRMTSTVKNSAQKGVRVRTQKVAGFRNLAFFPAALFACLVGYAIAGEDMVLIGVASRAANSTGWTNWDPTTYTGGSGSTQPGQPAGGVDPTGRAVALAVDMLNDCIDDMSKKSAALAAQWATGTMPVAETMSFTADLAARLATDPWRYLERLADPTQGGDK